QARRKPAERAGPCLLRTDPGPKLWPSHAATHEVTGDVRDPYDQENEYQCGESLTLVKAHQHRCELGRGGIEESRRSPMAALGREPGNGSKAHHECHKRSIDSPRWETKSCNRKRNAA